MILVLSMFTSCTSGSDNGKSTSKDTPEETKEPVAEKEPVTLTMMVQSHPSWPLKEDWLVWKLHDKNANVKLEVSGYQGNWWEAIPLIVASGDMPDLMWMVKDDAIKYGEQGAVEDLLGHLDEMPNLKAFMAEYPEEVPPMLSVDGKMYLHPSHGAYGEYDGIMLYRKDIFEKNQLELPKNYDELYATMQKLKELYPESTPLYFPSLNYFDNFGISFGIANGCFYDPESKTVKLGPAEDNYKTLLEFVVKAYQDKLIPIEFGNASGEKLDQMLTTDKTFIFHGYEGWIDKYNQLMREENPDFTLAFMPPPAAPDGTRYNARQFLLGEGIAVTTTSKQKEAAIAYIDYLFTEEAREATSWGEEGTTFKAIDGIKEFLPVVPNSTTAMIEFGIRTSGNTAWIDTDALQALKSEEARAAYEEGLKYMAPMSILPPLTKEENDAITIKKEAVGKYCDETISKFVLGQKSLDEWDEYVKQLKKLGMDDILKVYNDAEARRQQQGQ